MRKVSFIFLAAVAVSGTVHAQTKYVAAGKKAMVYATADSTNLRLSQTETIAFADKVPPKSQFRSPSGVIHESFNWLCL